MRRYHVIASILLTAIFLCITTCSMYAADQYSIIDLGTLGGSSSGAYDINNLGQVVGESYTLGGGTPHAFLWQNGSMQDLSSLNQGTYYSRASGINDSGQVVGGSRTPASGDTRPTLWQNGTIQDLGTFNYGTFNDGSFNPRFSDTSGWAYRINNSGQIAGKSQEQGPSPADHAALWQNGTIQDLGTLGGFLSSAYGINNSGQVVGDSQSGAGWGAPNHAFVWKNGTMQDLGTFGGNKSTAYSVNDSGQIVGGSNLSGDLSRHAFIFENGEMKDIDTLGGVKSNAYDINNSGEVVGSVAIPGSGRDFSAFIWENGEMKDLHTLLPSDSLWSLHKANAINDSGWIVGEGYINGAYHAFLMKPTVTPEPISFALFLLGGGAMAAIKFKKRKV